MQKISQFAREVQAKGYTSTALCEMVNKAGVKCSVRELGRACADDPANKTPKQELVYKTARQILDGLPVNPLKRNSFNRMCRERGVSMYDVWEYYNGTRVPKYTYSAFTKAAALAVYPFEIRMMDAARECLDEMAPKGT